MAETYELDCQNGNTLWADAITKEIKNACIAFDIMEGGDRPHKGWNKLLLTASPFFSGHTLNDL